MCNALRFTLSARRKGSAKPCINRLQNLAKIAMLPLFQKLKLKPILVRLLPSLITETITESFQGSATIAVTETKTITVTKLKRRQPY